MITVGRAAKECGVSRQTIYDYINDGLVSVDKDAYDNYGIIRVDIDETIKISKAREPLREKFRAENPGRKKKEEEGGKRRAVAA